MTYQIEISPTAVADVERIFLWMKEQTGDLAYRWVRDCYEVMLKLERFPNRCAFADESRYMNLPIRQLLYKKHYRILFTVQESESPNSEGVVQIHRVLRSSQDRLREVDDLLGDGEN